MNLQDHTKELLEPHYELTYRATLLRPHHKLI